MQILTDYKHFSSPSTSIGLTIGTFDGVHIGHQTLLNRLKAVAPTSVVFTFENHPYTVVKNITIPHLSTLPHRLALFEKMGIDFTILAPFTESFAKQTARDFLSQLKGKIPFSYLILGHDAKIGHDRIGDLSELGKELSFKVEYLDPVQKNGKVISSSEIRKSIQEGKLTEASSLLGRPYSIFAHVQHGAGKGGSLGFHTANLTVENLVLPPLGVYAVEVRLDHETLPAVANLGFAPTLHAERPPCLEVHLLDTSRDLYGKELEVLFLEYLRPERKFESIDALKSQIQADIASAKHLFKQRALAG